MSLALEFKKLRRTGCLAALVLAKAGVGQDVGHQHTGHVPLVPDMLAAEVAPGVHRDAGIHGHDAASASPEPDPGCGGDL